VIVCHCHGLNDRDLQARIEQGARAEAMLAQECGAGARCGGCLPAVRRLLDEHCAPDDEASVLMELARQ